MTDREYHCIMKTMEYLHEKLSPRKDCQTACELIKSEMVHLDLEFNLSKNKLKKA